MKKIILIGDIVDKGKDLKNTIEFVYKNWKNGKILMVLGNHENYVYKALNGVLETRDYELEKNFFDSISLFEKDDELKMKFFELVEASKEFLSHKDFIVTHSPCQENVLGKVSGNALKAQRNLLYPKRADFNSDEEYVIGLESYFSYLKKDSKHNHPLHIMGHVAVKRVVNFTNKYMIDTGCYAGGQLTSIQINKFGKPFIQHVPSKTLINDNSYKELVSIFDKKERIFNIDELEHEQRTRIKYLIKNKVNFISGTMSPADKNIEQNDLESLNEAIKYYENAGIEKIIIQPKYMGSRGNLYLFKDIEKTYLVSRNGYVVKENYVSHSKIVSLALPIHNKLIKLFEEKYNKLIKLIILDCEVLPWSLMGKGLIEEQFKSVAVGIKTEIELLEDTGFEERMAELDFNNEYKEYIIDSKVLNKEELIKKYGNAKEKTFRNYKSYIHIPLIREKRFLRKFDNQISIYSDDDLSEEIKPFSILKIVFEDDSEKTFENESNIDIYDNITEKHIPYAVLDFKKNKEVIQQYPYLNDQYFVDVHSNDHVGSNTAEGYYRYLTTNMNMEGVVIKPEKVYNKGIAPYLKVRNKNYLTIVYGHNYTFENKFEKLIKKKNIKRKLRISISEFELGMKMLSIPYSELNDKNNEYKQLLAQMILEVDNEKILDPRL